MQSDPDDFEQPNNTSESNSTPDDKLPSLEKRQNWNIDNKLSLLAIVVNSLMLLATFLLFMQALNQNKISERNYQLSKQAFDSTVSSNIATSQQVEKALSLQIQSLNVQLESVRQSNNQFLVSNKPFLSITNIERSSFSAEERLIRFYIVNSGKYPVQLLGTQANFAYGDKTMIRSLKQIKSDFYILNDIISAASFAPINGRDKTRLMQKTFDDLESGKVSFYMGYRVRFQNLLTMIKYEQQFVIEMNISGDLNTKILVNETKRL